MDQRTGLPIVGVIGAGQLARMMHQAAISLGQSLRILTDSPDDSAAVIARDVIAGDYRDLDQLKAFASGCDVVTFDHEHVPSSHIRAIDDITTARPSYEALRFAQNKAAMRVRLAELGMLSMPWLDLSTEPEPMVALADFGGKVGWPLVLKAISGGYDGRGVWIVDSITDAAKVIEDAPAPNAGFLAEAKVSIARELAAVVARSDYGQGAAWPVVETVQHNGICVEVIAPAPALAEEVADAAQALALGIAQELGVTGVLAVELFETTDGELVVNELAMRPHNSGHWTIEGARTSQFEQHIRAVLDYPLGATAMTAPWVVMANLLAPGVDSIDDVVPKRIDERLHHCMARWPDVKIHLYGKQMRPGRKVGHVTALGADLDDVRRRANDAADYLMNGDRNG